MARNPASPPPSHGVPEQAKTELGIGTFAGLMFAEAMSSVRLFGLGERVGFAWYLAWLLPAALDIYAITMVRFFSLIPTDHPLRRKAAHEAIIALVITVGCNGLYETIVEFASQLPAWAPGTLFVLVSALAPFVAGRLIHFRAAVGSGAAAPQEPAASELTYCDEDAAQRGMPRIQDATPQRQVQQEVPQETAAPAPQHDPVPHDDAAPQDPPAALPVPQMPYTPAARIEPPIAAPQPAPQPANDEDAAAADDKPRSVPKEQRPDIVIELIARHGTVSGSTVGHHTGTSRDTGIRDIRETKKLPDFEQRLAQARQRLREAGETVAEDTESAEDPERELVLA